LDAAAACAGVAREAGVSTVVDEPPAEDCNPVAVAGAPADPGVLAPATGRGGALAAGGGAAGGAGRAGGTVGMVVTRGIGFGAAAVGLFSWAAASLGATGRFAAVEGTDVGFTAAIGRAAFGAVADPAAELALAGVGLGFVGTAATRGAPLTGVGCDGAGFDVVAEGDADVGARAADDVVDAGAVCRVGEGVAADAAGVDGAGDTCGAAADDSVAVVADAVSLRAVVVPLVAVALGASAAGAGDVSTAGASIDAKSDGSIDTQVPEYAESMGVLAHEPDKEVSGSVTAGAGDFCVPLEFAGVDALGAAPTPTDVSVGAFAAADLPVWPAAAASAGGIPKPAGDPVFGVSAGGVVFVRAAARIGAGGAAGLGGGLGVAAGSEVPCAGFTSLAAESALEVLPFAGSSVDSNWSNPSKSSDSDS
jgi:hypothetical protein